MPARRRFRGLPPEPVPSPEEQRLADAARFAAVVKAAEQAKRDAKAAAKQAKLDAERRARQAAEHAVALAKATADVERTIATLKAARESRRGIPAAEAAWKEARARLITLETGAPPTWAPRPAVVESADGLSDEATSDDATTDGPGTSAA